MSCIIGALSSARGVMDLGAETARAAGRLLVAYARKAKERK